MKEINQLTGMEHTTYVHQTKDGKEIIVGETSMGGFFYLGSLLAFLVITVALAGAIYNVITGYQDYNVPFIIQNSIIASILLLADSLALYSLINDIQRKIEYKNAVKNGLMQKKKLTYGLIISRFTIISFLCFFGYGLCGLFGSMLLQINVPVEGFVILALIFATGWALLCLSALVGFMQGCIRIWREKHK